MCSFSFPKFYYEDFQHGKAERILQWVPSPRIHNINILPPLLSLLHLSLHLNSGGGGECACVSVHAYLHIHLVWVEVFESNTHQPSNFAIRFYTRVHLHHLNAIFTTKKMDNNSLYYLISSLSSKFPKSPPNVF